MSQDWEILGDDFDSINLDTILDDSLRALDVHLSPLGYLEKRALWFVDVINNPDLMIEPVDNSQLITNSEDEKIRK